MRHGMIGLLVLVLGMLPAQADDLERITLIGEGAESITAALDKLIREDHFGILVTTLKEVVPSTLPVDQIDGLAKMSESLSHHAQHWQEAGIHHKQGLELTTTVHSIAAAVRTAHPTNVDAFLAFANSLVAVTFERKNRRTGVKFDETFGAAAEVCLEAGKLDAARLSECELHASRILRTGAVYAGSKSIEVLDRALALLSRRDAKRMDSHARAEMGRVHLTRATLYLRDRKKSDAKKAALTGMAMVDNGTDLMAPETAGAYNDLLDLAASNKWVPHKNVPFKMEAATKEGFTFDQPTGTGWHYGNEGNLKGKGRFLVERRRPDRLWVQFGVAAFSKDLTYGEGDVSGAKPKAILGLTKQVWSGVLTKPKSGSANKKYIPKNLTCVDSYMLIGRNRANVSTSVFSWACTGESEEWMYVISVVIEGRATKSLPLQIEAMLASLKETTEK